MSKTIFVLASFLALAAGCQTNQKPHLRGVFFGGIGDYFLDPENLGKHQYKNGLTEKNGFVYTCQGGFIDIGHLRESADRTAYIAAITKKNIIKKETEFSSQDGKFQITSDALKTNRFFTIYNTPGYPVNQNYNVVSEIYNLSVVANNKDKAQLTIRANTEGELKIVGYDGANFKEYETKVDGKMASAEVDLMELYFVSTLIKQ